jgi:predicted nucleic acid-binding protein
VTTPSGSNPIVVDSSGWLEYITGDEKAALFAPYFEGSAPVLVPVVVLYEVRKILLLRKFPVLADIFVSEALRRPTVAIDDRIALAATEISIDYRLAMADALLYATAQSRNAHFVTSDAHFENLPDVTLL